MSSTTAAHIDALRAAASALVPARHTVVSIADNAVAAGFVVQADGRVDAPRFDSGNGESDLVFQAGLDSDAATYEAQLKSALTTFVELDEQSARTLDEISVRLSTYGGGFRSQSALFGTSLDGTADARLISSGTATDSNLERIGKILSHDQGVSIEYLESFYNGIGKGGLFDLYGEYKESEAAGDPNAGRAADSLANGLLTLSNPEYGGSWEQIPQDLRDTILHGYDPDPDFNRNYSDLSDLGALGTIIGEADPMYRPGTEMALEFDRVAGHMANISTQTGGFVHPLPPGMDYEDTANTFLDIGTRNTEASHHLLSGTDADGNPAGYNRDEVLMPLFTHAWGDDGAALSGLTDWIASDAKPADPGDPVQVAQAERAGNAAFGLAQVMSTYDSGWNGGNNFDRMLHVPGAHDVPGTDTIGDVNPIAVQSFSGALAPYVADMVGADEELTGTHGFGSLGPVEATRVFTVLDTDPAAGALINGAALARAAEFDRQFALEEVDGDGRYSLGTHSGHLRGLVEVGLNSAVANDNLDGQTAVDTRNQYRANAFAVGQTLVTGAVTAMPGGVVAGPIVYSVGTLISADVIDAEGRYVGDAPGIKSFNSSTSLTDTDARNGRMYNMLSALVDQGRVDPATLPTELAVDGTLNPLTNLWGNAFSNELPRALDESDIGNDERKEYLDVAANGDNDLQTIIYAGRKDGPDAFSDVLMNNRVMDGANRWPGTSR